ncbi:putative dual-specificity kinase TKL-Pl-4 family [Helianthus debilis subsp. tardiflorus]
MDLKKYREESDGEGGIKRSESRSLGSSPKNSSGQLGSKSKDLGNMSSNKDSFLRADKIDFKSWDVQLDKHLSRVWSRDKEKETNTKKEEWEIDLAKLDIRNVIAHGTYGTVYKGVYDGQDVAVKVLDWGEDGLATAAETANLRTSFRQEVAVWHKLDHPNVTKFVGASMGTSDLKIPSNNTSNMGQNSLPSRACCVVVEYLPGGTLKEIFDQE